MTYKFKNWLSSSLFMMLLLMIGWRFGNLFSCLFILAAFLIHEFSHILCSELLGYSVYEWTPHPLSGLEIDPAFTLDPDAEFMIAIAGPLANWLIVAGVFYLNLLGIRHHNLQYWLQINFFMGLINLIPAMPFDGGRIFRAWINKKFNFKVSRKITIIISIFTGGFFLSLAWVKVLKPPAKIFMAGIGIFILCYVLLTKNPILNYGWNLFQHKKKQFSQKDYLIIKPVMVNPTTPLKTIFHHINSQDYLLFFVSDKDQNLYIITEEKAWNTFVKYGFEAIFKMAIPAPGNKTCRIPLNEVE